MSTSKKVIINSSEVSLKWSIDRITIVGNLKKFHWVRDDLEPIALAFDKIWMIFEDRGVALSYLIGKRFGRESQKMSLRAKKLAG